MYRQWSLLLIVPHWVHWMGEEENKVISRVANPCLVPAGGVHSLDCADQCWLYGGRAGVLAFLLSILWGCSQCHGSDLAKSSLHCLGLLASMGEYRHHHQGSNWEKGICVYVLHSSWASKPLPTETDYTNKMGFHWYDWWHKFPAKTPAALIPV